MIRFDSDYAEGAHEKVIDLLVKTNMEQTGGYGTDEYCDKARALIKKVCNNETLDVHFLVGGTQANATVINSILRPYQGVISAETGHISVNEAGIIESKGHKVLTIPSSDGKVYANQVKELNKAHWAKSNHEHIVQPGMVYISFSTENGTIYSKAELEELSKACKEEDLMLFMDGARLGYGLMAENCDLTLEDIAKNCDVFYIGGTKVGALFGEAIVIANTSLKKDFRYYMKQNGGLLAKGRLLGIQFLALFEEGLYFEISKHANEQAMRIHKAFEEKGFDFQYASMTNQQFPIVPKNIAAKLSEKYVYTLWGQTDNEHLVLRFCTSWATKSENVDELIKDIKKI